MLTVKEWPPCRAAKTVFFLFTMVGSLLLFSAPTLLVAVLDLLLPVAILNTYASTPVTVTAIAAGLRGGGTSYDFRASLLDLPLVSLVRSVLVLCAYGACDVPGRSRGPYLGVAMLSSMVSGGYVAAKAFVVFGRPWRPPAEGTLAAALMVVSVVLAVGHGWVAYRTSCRERRKLLVYRIDLEAVPLSKIGYEYHKSHK